MLDPSSTRTELLVPFLATGERVGIATGPVGARVKVKDTSGPCGDAEEDMDSEAREARGVAIVCSTMGLGTDVSTERKS